jgi:alpha-glucosidase
MGLGRDPERTPMQWDGGPNAGFTDGTPWLPLADDAATAHVAAQRDDPRSMLALYRKLIDLRCAEPTLYAGSYTPVVATGDLLAYVREGGGRRFLVALNLGSQAATLAANDLGRGQVALSTHLDRAGELVDGEVALRGDEGVIVELE